MSAPTPIPPDLWRVVLGYLPGAERVRVGQVCKQWKAMAPVTTGPAVLRGMNGSPCWFVPILIMSINNEDVIFKKGMTVCIYMLWQFGRWKIDRSLYRYNLPAFSLTDPSTRLTQFITVRETPLDDDARVGSLFDATRFRFRPFEDSINHRSVDLTGRRVPIY